MTFSLQNVVQLPLNKLVVLNHHQNTLNILLLLTTHVPLTLQQILLGNVKTSTEVLDLLVWLLLLNQLLQFTQRVVLVNANHSKTQLSRNLLHFVRVSLHLPERTLVRIDHLLRLHIQ